MKPGDHVTLRAEAGSVVPAGRHTVSRVNPDGSFHVGGNTAVWPARVEEDAPVTDPKPETHESLAKRLDAGGARFTEIDTTLHEIRELLKPLPEMQADIAKTREIVEAWAAVKTMGKFLKWFSGLLAAVVAIFAAFKVAVGAVWRLS